jgi:hypothetical protein
MNKTLPVILLLAALGLGAAFAYQYQQTTSLHEQVSKLQAELAAAREQSAREAAESQRAREKVESYKAANEQLEARNKELAASGPPAAAPVAANPDAKKDEGGFAGMMKKMFTDPEMKKAMRSQQAMGVQMMYGELAKELGLAPDDARQVMELLADRQMAMSAEGMKMFGGDAVDGGAAEESSKKIAESQKEYDAQLEAILGKDGMAKMKDYERTIGERMQMQQYKQAFAASGTPLEEKQAAGLLNIMKEERLKEAPSPLDPTNKDVGAAMKAMQSDEVFDKLMASQDELGRRVLTRARTVLSPDQMTQFEKIQKQQLDLQRMGMKMGRQMMKNGQEKAPAPPAPPQPVLK